MQLKNCDLDANVVVMKPVTRGKPERDWIAGRDSGIIPKSLFALYSRANYLSFGKAPRFLSDSDNLLFSYFSMILRSIKGGLTDTDYELESFLAAHAQIPDYGKKARGEPSDPGANDLARRHLRMFLMSLQSALDASADLTAMFLTGSIKDLRLGRARFLVIYNWVGRALPKSEGLVVTPERHYLELLHNRLHPLIKVTGPERDWLPFMRMLRNKSAHLGDAVFRYIWLHDRQGAFYTFIPRRWPYIWEAYYRTAGSEQEDYPPLLELLQSHLIHQDIRSYCEGLRRKVTTVVDAVVDVIGSAYEEFSPFQTNKAALAELQASSETFQFERFLD